MSVIGHGVEICTSTTRPTIGLTAGLEIFETDTGNKLIWNGSSWRLLAETTVTTGGVLQVVFNHITDAATISGGSGERSTPLTASITPKSITSSILVMINSAWGAPLGANHYAAGLRRTVNGVDTNIGRATNAGNRPAGTGGPIYQINQGNTSGGQHDALSHSLVFLDNPNTVLPVTYRLMVWGYGLDVGATIYLNRTYSDRTGGSYDPRFTSSVTLMEISG